jgi:ribosome biogenesis protein Tsr3
MANSKNKLLSKITSYQYLKSKLLLYISISRKTKPKNEQQNVSVNTTNFLHFSYYINKAYALLKKIKFSMTFKKINDKNLENYLVMIESSKNI